jgi:hypothetical protein
MASTSAAELMRASTAGWAISTSASGTVAVRPVSDVVLGEAGRGIWGIWVGLSDPRGIQVQGEEAAPDRNHDGGE